MGKKSVSNIVTMLLTGNDGLLSPEAAFRDFENHPDRESKKLIYSLDECRLIYDFVVKNGLEKKNKVEIMEVWNDR